MRVFCFLFPLIIRVSTQLSNVFQIGRFQTSLNQDYNYKASTICAHNVYYKFSYHV